MAAVPADCRYRLTVFRYLACICQGMSPTLTRTVQASAAGGGGRGPAGALPDAGAMGTVALLGAGSSGPGAEGTETGGPGAGARGLGMLPGMTGMAGTGPSSEEGLWVRPELGPGPDAGGEMPEALLAWGTGGNGRDGGNGRGAAVPSGAVGEGGGAPGSASDGGWTSEPLSSEAVGVSGGEGVSGAVSVSGVLPELLCHIHATPDRGWWCNGLCSMMWTLWVSLS